MCEPTRRIIDLHIGIKIFPAHLMTMLTVDVCVAFIGREKFLSRILCCGEALTFLSVLVICCQVEEKGLTPEVAEKIGKLVQKRGSPLVLLEELKQSGSPFSEDEGSAAALEELGVLFKYLKASKCIDRIVFDLSLARGLDYYTGVIYEATLKGSNQVRCVKTPRLLYLSS